MLGRVAVAVPISASRHNEQQQNLLGFCVRNNVVTLQRSRPDLAGGRPGANQALFVGHSVGTYKD